MPRSSFLFIYSTLALFVSRKATFIDRKMYTSINFWEHMHSCSSVAIHSPWQSARLRFFVPSSPKGLFWNPHIQGDGFRKEGLWEDLTSCGVSAHHWGSCISERDPGGLAYSFQPCEDTVGDWRSATWKRAHVRTHHTNTLTVDVRDCEQ